MAKEYNDIYPDGNAASKWNPAAVVSPWVAELSSVTLTAELEVDQHMIKGVATDGASDRSAYEFAVVSGVVYTVKMQAKRSAGSTSATYAWVGFDEAIDQPLTEDWVLYTFNVTANITGDAKIRMYTRPDSLSEVYFRNFEILDSSIAPPTTTVKVEWTDSTTQGVTGHKVYRDDVEIADVGMGVETYDDDTAETGTTYKYEVQAYSANNETDEEVVDTNVKSITTAS